MKPTIRKITDKGALADRRVIEAVVNYQGNGVPSHTMVVTFHGPAGSFLPGPVLMVSDSGTETWVDSPARFGVIFDGEWVERFFKSQNLD